MIEVRDSLIAFGDFSFIWLCGSVLAKNHFRSVSGNFLHPINRDRAAVCACFLSIGNEPVNSSRIHSEYHGNRTVSEAGWIALFIHIACIRHLVFNNDLFGKIFGTEKRAVLCFFIFNFIKHNRTVFIRKLVKFIYLF